MAKPRGTDRHTTPRRFVGIPDKLWEPYGRLLGRNGRSADLRRYIAWRLTHPKTPLPGEATRQP